jgi:hypothetical protein
MRPFVIGILSAALLLGLASAAVAEKRQKHRKHHKDYGYSAAYPGASQRQLRNLRAYERGEYYETDSNALPVGSRPWWEAKQREQGGDFRP